MFEILRFIVSLLTLVSSIQEEARVRTDFVVTEDIVLQKEANLVITAWKGSARCDQGEIYLQEPDAKAVAPYRLPTKRSVIIGSALIFDHLPTSRETIVLGPYHDDTKITLSFRFYGDCNRWFSQSSQHVKIKKYPTENWEFAIEDNLDNDFNDLYVQLTVQPIKGAITDSVTASSAFNIPANYLFPWKKGNNYQITTLPGQGHHVGRAFDFGMKKGDQILASEKGLVLWVEDSFGPGNCNKLLLAKVNVLVIQTEEGVNQNYLHLQKDSVKEAGIKIGDIVEQGQFIGRAGNSGYSCSNSGGDGVHLHIEWVHNCYDLDQARDLRLKYPIGQPTLRWNCPNFPKDAPFIFK